MLLEHPWAVPTLIALLSATVAYLLATLLAARAKKPMETELVVQREKLLAQQQQLGTLKTQLEQAQQQAEDATTQREQALREGHGLKASLTALDLPTRMPYPSCPP